jgi:hypothetical protein
MAAVKTRFCFPARRVIPFPAFRPAIKPRKGGWGFPKTVRAGVQSIVLGQARVYVFLKWIARPGVYAGCA